MSDAIDGLTATQKQKLKDEIGWRIRFVMNDCSTFLWVRNENAEYYEQHKGSEVRAGLGGGNFMIANTLFSALNLLAKIHLRLRRQDRFYTDDQRKEVNRLREALKTIPEEKLSELLPQQDWKMIRGWLKPPRVDDCNETEAFIKLITDMGPAVPLGIPPGDAKEIWDDFRNALAHMSTPASFVEVGNGQPSFRRHNGKWFCNVDRLSKDIDSVAIWICDEIASERDAERITDTLQWLNSSERPRLTMTSTTTSDVQGSVSVHGSTAATLLKVPATTLKRVGRSFDAGELRKAVKELAFDVYHFQCYKRLCRNADVIVWQPTAHQAALYSLLLHLRLLLDFFYGPPAKDDVWVGHFRDEFPIFDAQFDPVKNPTQTEATQLSVELNKRLAHFTATRWEKKPPSMDYYNPYIDAVEALIVQFRDALPNDVRQILTAEMDRWERAHPWA